MNAFDLILRGTESQALTPNEIKKIARYDFNFHLYEQLISYKELRELFLNHDTGEYKEAAVILYQESRYSGHYVCLIKREDSYEFFDSFGLKPDEELQYAHYISTPYLRNLIDNERVTYNTVKLQQNKSSISTCGRYAGVRIAMRELSLPEFHSFFRGSHMNPDKLVTLITLLDKN